MAGKKVALGHKGTGNAGRANAGLGGGRISVGRPRTPPSIRNPNTVPLDSMGRRQFAQGFTFQPKASPKS